MVYQRVFTALVMSSLLIMSVSAGTQEDPEVLDPTGDQSGNAANDWTHIDIEQLWIAAEAPDGFTISAVFNAAPTQTTGETLSFSLSAYYAGAPLQLSSVAGTVSGNQMDWLVSRDLFTNIEPGKTFDIALLASGSMASGTVTGSDRAPDADFGRPYVIGSQAEAGMDYDSDGIDDRDELGTCTNPALADTDGDGANDGNETIDGTNPCDPDSDNDGLNDGDEKAAGTNPNNPDTDGDGLNDGDEVDGGSDPLNADADGDGLNDAQERAAGTDPYSADSDGDGLTDKEEQDAGLDPRNPEDAGADPDGDGVSSADELAAGTEPFTSDLEPETEKSAGPLGTPWWLLIVIIVVVVALLILIIVLLKKRREEREAEEQAMIEAELAALEAEEAELDADLEAVAAMEPEPAPEDESTFKPLVIDEDYLSEGLDDADRLRARRLFEEREARYLDHAYPGRRRDVPTMREMDFVEERPAAESESTLSLSPSAPAKSIGQPDAKAEKKRLKQQAQAERRAAKLAKK